METQTLEQILSMIGGKSREQMLADKLRGEATMRDANSQAHSLDLLNFAAGGSNNPALIKAMGGLTASNQAQFKPVQMGSTGFAIPGAGSFVENPMNAEEKQMQRVTALQQTLSALSQRDAASKEGNALKMAMALMANNSRDQELEIKRMLAEAKIREAEGKTDKQREKTVNQLSLTLDKAGIPELLSAMNLAESRLAAHKSGDLPGYGRIEGLVPNAVSSENMQLTRQDLQTAANIMLKARSGSAVTESESRRFLMELGSGKGMTEKAIREGMRKLRMHLDSRVSNILAGVDDDTLEAYNARTANPISRPATFKRDIPGKTPKPVIPNDGFGELKVAP